MFCWTCTQNKIAAIHDISSHISVGLMSRNLYLRRSATPGYQRRGVYQNMLLPRGQEELRKLRHREAQRRYYAKKKMQMQLKMRDLMKSKSSMSKWSVGQCLFDVNRMVASSDCCTGQVVLSLGLSVPVHRFEIFVFVVIYFYCIDKRQIVSVPSFLGILWRNGCVVLVFRVLCALERAHCELILLGCVAALWFIIFLRHEYYLQELATSWTVHSKSCVKIINVF